MKKTLILCASVVSAIALTGCTSQFTPGGPAEPVTEGADTTDTSTVVNTEVEPDDEDPQLEGDSPVLSLGESATYDDGLEVTVNYVDTVRLSEVGSSICEPGAPVAVLELVVVNGTEYTFNPWTDFISDLEAQYTDTDGYAVSADSVFDSSSYNGGYELSHGQEFATLRPGQMGSDYYGYCVADMEPGSLYVTLDPTLFDEPGYRDAIEWEE